MQKKNEGATDVKPIDPRLEAIVDKMFQRCYDDKQYKQVCNSQCLFIYADIDCSEVFN